MALVDYFLWHYTIAPREIIRLAKNYSIATWHKFLILQHARTLFAPWHRMMASIMFPASGVGDKIGNWIVDVYIRLIAAIIRIVIISTGLVVQAVVLIFFIVLIFVWIFWPIVSIFFILKGINLIF